MASLLPQLFAMPKLELVKMRPDGDTPRRERDGSGATERRYRYPAEEIWEVSDDRWHVAEAPPADDSRRGRNSAIN